VSNLAGTVAGLDLDSFGAGGSSAQLSADVATFSNLAASSSHPFVATLSDANNGTLSTIYTLYTLNFSDEDLPGAQPLGSLTVHLKAIVATPGDADLNGTVNFDDYVRIDVGFNSGLTGWENGDFNGSGAIDFDDYVLIDISFNSQGGTLQRAVNYLSGDDRSASGMDSEALQQIVQHFGQFGLPYASAFLGAVPEPAVVGALGISAGCLLARSWRRRT
jgi:hypothetical protein